MQKLLLAEDIFDELDFGKNVTIRKGRRDILLGDLLFESKENGKLKVVNVINVHYCKLANVYTGDLKSDGFSDHNDMWDKMKRFYPDITFDTEVTTIRFARKAGDI